MGKSSRSKRFGAFKPSPTGLLSAKDLDLSMQINGDHSSNVPGIITTILEKIQDAITEERACGCQMMAGIVSQPRAIDLLLKRDIVKITAPLFLDANVDVQKNALGAMRNVTVFGDERVCDKMVKEDVFTPLSTLIRKFGNDWSPEKEAGKQQTATEILIEAAELTSNLCESSSQALQRFNTEDLISVLLPKLQMDVYGFPLSCSVARCLHVVSENNPVVLKVLQQNEVVSGLVNIIMMKPSHMAGVLMRVLTAGILLNLKDIDLSPYYDGIIQMTGEVLEMNCLTLICNAMDKMKEAEQNEEYDPEFSCLDVDQLMSAQQTCLELLANLCCSDDEWEEMEGSEEEMSDDPVGATCSTVDMVEDDEKTLCLPSEVHCVLTKHNILSKIMDKAKPLESERVTQLQASKFGKACMKKLEDLQSRALLCLSNMISAMDEGSLAHFPVAIPTLWSNLYCLGKSHQVTENEDYRWAVTSAMRAVLERMAQLHPNDLKNVSESDLHFLVSLGAESQNTEAQINVIKLLSSIGCVLSSDVNSFPLLKIIGTVLVQICSSSQDLIVIAEALDSIFDVFKEDETDVIAREISLVEKLKGLQPAFKSKISSERKKLGDSYGLIMMARTNLNGFLKYKASKR